MKRVINLSFGDIFLFERYLIVEFNEGVIHNTELNETIIAITEAHFGDKPFGYIANRVNSHSVDPIVYHQSGKIHNLKAIAIISFNLRNMATAALEKTFFCKPFRIFENLDMACDWIDQVVIPNNITA